MMKFRVFGHTTRKIQIILLKDKNIQQIAIFLLQLGSWLFSNALQVKPVRDSVHDAIQLWKTLPGSGPDSPISADNSGKLLWTFGICNDNTPWFWKFSFFTVKFLKFGCMPLSFSSSFLPLFLFLIIILCCALRRFSFIFIFLSSSFLFCFHLLPLRPFSPLLIWLIFWCFFFLLLLQ